MFNFIKQIVARYNFERLSNNMARVSRFNNIREPIPEAYFPKMDSLVASRAWPSRAANTRLSDLNRELDQIKYDVNDLERWSSRFVEACHQGFVMDVCTYIKKREKYFLHFLNFIDFHRHRAIASHWMNAMALIFWVILWNQAQFQLIAIFMVICTILVMYSSLIHMIPITVIWRVLV